MYTGHGFNNWGIGDVDVIKVGDTYRGSTISAGRPYQSRINVDCTKTVLEAIFQSDSAGSFAGSAVTSARWAKNMT